MDKSASGELQQPESSLKAGEAQVVAEVVVRDKDGNVKYAGPLKFNVVKEQEDGSHS